MWRISGRQSADAHQRRAVRGATNFSGGMPTRSVSTIAASNCSRRACEQLVAVGRDRRGEAVVAQRVRDVRARVAVGVEQRDAARRDRAVRGPRRQEHAERAALAFDRIDADRAAVHLDDRFVR